MVTRIKRLTSVVHTMSSLDSVLSPTCCLSGQYEMLYLAALAFQPVVRNHSKRRQAFSYPALQELNMKKKHEWMFGMQHSHLKVLQGHLRPSATSGGHLLFCIRITLFCQCVAYQLASLRCARSNFRGICVAKMAILTQHSREPAFARKRGRVLSTAECEEETYGSRSKVLNKNFNLGGTQPTLLYDFTSSLCGVTQGNPAKHKLGVRFAQGWRKCFHVLS